MIVDKPGVDIDFQRLFQDIPTPLMILDHDLCFMAANDCYLEMTSRTHGELIGRFVFDAFPESDDRIASIRCAFQRALAGEVTVLERNVFAIRGRDGVVEDSWWYCEQRPVIGDDGAIIGVMQHAHNVSREMAAERMRDAISIEYDHRVRNLLSKVSAIARRTAQSAESTQQFIEDFDPRILSMARAHQLLVEGNWDRIDLGDLISCELAPYSAKKSGVRDSVRIDGPEVMLSSRVAQALGMALHELATNAAKHGALVHDGGHLDVSWTVDSSNGAIAIDWTETNTIPLAMTRRSGFGSIIIDRILPSETGGSVSRDFTTRGLACTIIIPQPDKN